MAGAPGHAEGLRAPGRVALVTQGCKVNQYETQVILESLLARGWELVPFGDAADLTVINSCTVTDGADRDLKGAAAVICDGVSSAADSEIASQTAVTGFINV